LIPENIVSGMILGRIGFVLVVSVLVGACSIKSVPGPAGQLTPDEHFKYASVGIEEEAGIPYWIWRALPEVCADRLPAGRQGYAALGFQYEPGHDLPVGFAKRRVGGGDRVAINCAFCHVTAVRTAPGERPRLLLGGPTSTVSPQAYARFLEACGTSPQFTAANVLAAIEKVGGQLSWTERLTHRFLLVPGVRRGLRDIQRANAWMNSKPLWGPGRIDPFNPVKFGMLRMPVDATIGNSDMMPIWNVQGRASSSLHWDGLIHASVRDAVVTSALGDGARPKSLDFPSLARVEEWILRTPPPRFPFPIDQRLAANGRAIYDKQCAQCHAPGGERTGKVIPLGETGTDRHRLDMWTKEAVVAYSAYADDYPWDFKNFKKTDGYVAVPLDGLWARAPYLHNGSVPSLTDLLEPVERRPKLFYRGSDLYDPVRMGFASNGSEIEQTGFKYDTSLPGNSNTGHLWGVDLTPDEKRALVEFMKTL
jgi:cytochrome c5